MDIGRRESRGLTSGKWEKTNGRFVRVLLLINPTGPQKPPQHSGVLILTRPLLSGSITYTRVDISTCVAILVSPCATVGTVSMNANCSKKLVCSALAPFAARIGKWYALCLGCVSRRA